MKNYYAILEVSENASKEVIDKAYKVLAKKYHPDLQEEKNKKVAEEKIKSLNEAYEVLSNPQKKQAYDSKIEKSKKEEEKRYINNISNVYARQYENVQRDVKKNRTINKQFKKEYKRELRRLKIEDFFRKIVAIASVIAVLVLICFIIYIIPTTNSWIHNLYENNVIIKAIIDALS